MCFKKFEHFLYNNISNYVNKFFSKFLLIYKTDTVSFESRCTKIDKNILLILYFKLDTNSSSGTVV